MRPDPIFTAAARDNGFEDTTSRIMWLMHQGILESKDIIGDKPINGLPAGVTPEWTVEILYKDAYQKLATGDAKFLLLLGTALLETCHAATQTAHEASKIRPASNKAGSGSAGSDSLGKVQPDGQRPEQKSRDGQT